MAKTTNPEHKMAEAALRLAAMHGWNALTLDQIAKAAKLPLTQAKKSFASKEGVLPTIVQLITSRTKASLGKPDRKATPHDRLFEVMMTRFDSLQASRRGIQAIMEAVRRDPRMATQLLPAQAQAMQDMLGLAHLKPVGPKQAFVTAGLLAIYGLALCRWKTDQTEDMSKTMAALDRHLRRAQRLAEIIFREH